MRLVDGRRWQRRGASYDFDWHTNNKENPNRDPDWNPPIQFSHYCGDDVLKEAYDECYTEDAALCLTSLFVTGARATEFIEMKASMFKKDQPSNTIFGYGLPVLKLRHHGTRDINVLCEDPLVSEFYKFVEDIRKHYGEDAYLTASIREDRDEWLNRYNSEIEYLKKQISEIKRQKGVSISAYQEAEKLKAKQKELERAQAKRLKTITYRLYQDVYDAITSIMKPPNVGINRLREMEKATGKYQIKSGPFYPSRLRMERASHLTSERGYDTPLLMAYFGWVATDTPTNYVKQSAQEILKRNLDSRYDRDRRELSQIKEAKNTPPEDGVPKYLG